MLLKVLRGFKKPIKDIPTTYRGGEKPINEISPQFNAFALIRITKEYRYV